jgi:hypothetical protein
MIVGSVKYPQSGYNLSISLLCAYGGDSTVVFMLLCG